jgi:hypothetical protein
MKYQSSGTLLTLAFIILKLCHVITWSWWWILSPIWISVIIGLSCVYILYRVKKKGKKNQIGMAAKSKWGQKLEEMRERSNQGNK